MIIPILPNPPHNSKERRTMNLKLILDPKMHIRDKEKIMTPKLKPNPKRASKNTVP